MKIILFWRYLRANYIILYRIWIILLMRLVSLKKEPCIWKTVLRFLPKALNTQLRAICMQLALWLMILCTSCLFSLFLLLLLLLLFQFNFDKRVSSNASLRLTRNACSDNTSPYHSSTQSNSTLLTFFSKHCPFHFLFLFVVLQSMFFLFSLADSLGL